MSNINCATLLEDIKMMLPPENVLTDSQLSIIIQRIMASVGSDNKYYGEVACKSLRAVADMNMSRGTVDDTRIKREKVGDEEYEYFESSNTNGIWPLFKDSLTDLCPIMYSYSLPSGKGISINSGRIGSPLHVESYLCPFK